jgi:hypothetical protein
MQSKWDFIKRPLGTAVAMNSYPPTRDRLWDMLHEQKSWQHFSYQTTSTNQKRIDWGLMAEKLYNAKIGFAPPGATGKTERHLFTPAYTVMMKQKNEGLEFPYEWVDGINCIEMVHDTPKEIIPTENFHTFTSLNKEKTKEKIIQYLDQPEKLYDIYVNGWRNDENYRLPFYVKNYIAKTIKDNL